MARCTLYFVILKESFEKETEMEIEMAADVELELERRGQILRRVIFWGQWN